MSDAKTLEEIKVAHNTEATVINMTASFVPSERPEILTVRIEPPIIAARPLGPDDPTPRYYIYRRNPVTDLYTLIDATR